MTRLSDATLARAEYRTKLRQRVVGMTDAELSDSMHAIREEIERRAEQYRRASIPLSDDAMQAARDTAARQRAKTVRARLGLADNT